MALSTINGISKRELIDYLENSDIPDDANLMLKKNMDGIYILFFRWGDAPKLFGHTVVKFDIESKEVVEIESKGDLFSRKMAQGNQ